MDKLVLGIILVMAVIVGFSSIQEQEAFAANANLSVFANSEFPDFIVGVDVVMVVVHDSDINDVDEGKGEPDVTVNGDGLRMVQGINGVWYGYFAEIDQALIADSSVAVEGTGLDFGVFCGPNSGSDLLGEGISSIDIGDTLGIALKDPNDVTGATNGFDPPGSLSIFDCDPIPNDSDVTDNMNVLNDEVPMNWFVPGGANGEGQLGIDPDFWPFIQLYSFDDEEHVVVQYNKGGGAQTTTLTFSISEPEGVEPPPVIPPVETPTPNLSVFANPEFPDFVFGADVVEVVVIDSDIIDIDEAKGEPDVTVNGDGLRMVQGINGHWYGYFAEIDQALIADSASLEDGEGLDFGTFCAPTFFPPYFNFLSGGISFILVDAVAITVPDSDDVNNGVDGSNPPQPLTNGCTNTVDGDRAIEEMNVIEEIPEINPGGDHVLPGQIGVNPDFWPFIQLYPFEEDEDVVVQYHKGGGTQTTILTFSTSDPLTPIIGEVTSEEYDIRGHKGLRYHLPIENWNNYPPELFVSSPDLPPCGLNESASRTWVDIYNFQTDAYIYGFCALDSPDDLIKIWFAVPDGMITPQSVYVELIDRLEDKVYRSDPTSITTQKSVSSSISTVAKIKIK